MYILNIYIYIYIYKHTHISEYLYINGVDISLSIYGYHEIY